jgi:hypothetical protein
MINIYINTLTTLARSINQLRMSLFDISTILDISNLNINSNENNSNENNSIESIESMEVDSTLIFGDCSHNWINFCTIDKTYSIQLYFGICQCCANIKAIYNCSYKKKSTFIEYDMFSDSDELLLEEFYSQIISMSFIECLSLQDYIFISKSLIVTLTNLFRYDNRYYYMIKDLESKFNL